MAANTLPSVAEANGNGNHSGADEPPDNDYDGPAFVEMDPTGRYGRVSPQRRAYGAASRQAGRLPRPYPVTARLPQHSFCTSMRPRRLITTLRAC